MARTVSDGPRLVRPDLTVRRLTCALSMKRVTGIEPALSAWELYGAARLQPGDSATCGDIGGLTVSDRDYLQALLLSGTQRARRPLGPELAALLRQRPFPS